jgi:hypothetical protein
MISPKEKYHLCQLVLKFKDETITPEEQAILDDILKRHPDSAEHVVQIIEVYTRLMRSEGLAGSISAVTKPLSADEMLHQFSEWENVAPAVKKEKSDSESRPLIQKVVREKNSRPVNKTSLTIAVLSMAAVLLITVVLRLAPKASFEVATLTSSIDAVFGDHESYPDGSRLSCYAKPLWLTNGIVEITFDYGAKVVIEAPAEFQLNSAENIMLRSGRLYAYVPGPSKGFMVETPNSRVIDLGTEFGVKVDFDGASDIYMMKGKASLFPGGRGQTGQGQILTVGEARRVGQNGNTQVIPMNEGGFVRAVEGRKRVVWRGQALDLSDMVGGGCGLGTGRLENAIDPLTGQMLSWSIPPERAGEGDYVQVPSSDYIDGVFVPDGGNGPVRVTSAGHLWKCPDTTNFFKYPIVNSLRIPDHPEQFGQPSPIPQEDMLLTKVSEGQVPLRMMGPRAQNTPPAPGDSSLFIHSNLGITFDLDEIRKVVPNTRITRFKSIFGVGEITAEVMYLDLWVLVDGQPRLAKPRVDSQMLIDIVVELSDTDRFLSLVITDSSDIPGEIVSGIAYDWGLFMNPRLDVEYSIF